MAKKRPNTSRLFQLALNDAIKSSATKLERNSQWISTKQMIPQTVELKQGIASQPKSSLVQQHGSISLPYHKDLNKSCQETSKLATEGIADFLPAQSTRSSNYSSTIKNPISVQDSSIYALPISLCEPGNLQMITDCHNPKWIDPPSYDPLSFCNGKEFEESYGYEPGCDLLPEHLIGTTCNDHLSKESRTVENELCGIGSAIPAPKSADDFFNSSSYTDQVNALKYEAVIPNPKSLNVLSDSYMFGKRVCFQDDQTAIPSPKPCDSMPTSFSFPDVVGSTNTKVLLPSPKDYDGLSNSEHSIPNPRSSNFFNSFPFSDEICLSNTGITVSSPKTYKSFASSVPLTDNICSINCDKIVSAKQCENYNVELNSDIYHHQMSTSRSNGSCTKSGWRSRHSGENKSCSFESCKSNLPSCDIYTSGSKPSNNLCQQLPILRDYEENFQKNVACDNLFPNDYLDELIKMGSNDISGIEKDCLEDVPKTNSKLLNLNDNATRSANKKNNEKLTHTFDLKNQNLKPSPYSSFHTPTMVDFEETSTSRKRAVKLTNSSLCHLDFDYRMNQSISTVSHSQNHLDQLGVDSKLKSEFCKNESKLERLVPPFLGHFDILSKDSTDHLTVSGIKLTDNLKTIDCFEDKEDSVKATNKYLLSFDRTDESSTSNFTTSLDSLVDSNFENSTDIANIIDCMSASSRISNSKNSSNESIASELIYNSFALDVFCSESKSKSLLECNRLIGSSFCKNNSFSRPTTSIDSGIEFLSEDAVSLCKSSTCSDPELNVFPFIPEEKSSKFVCLDKNMNSADSKARYTATSTEFSESEVDGNDFLTDDQQRIDNLIAQFM